jgi:transposase-like protein
MTRNSFVLSSARPCRRSWKRRWPEIKRRTRAVRIFLNQESCLRLVRPLAVETHEGWLEEHLYPNM